MSNQPHQCMEGEQNKKAIILKPIGVIKSPLKHSQYVPHDKLLELESTIELDPELLPCIEGLDTYYSVFVLYHLDRITPEERVTAVHPCGDVSRPKRGVLATRSPLRPTPIGQSHCIITSINGTTITVRGLDALDNTPLIDVKPGLKQAQKELFQTIFL